MKGVQLSLDLFDGSQEEIIVIVERPNGTTFEQRLKLKNGEKPQLAIKRYQKTLGDPYGWYTERGQRFRYIKKGAYLVIDWHYA